MTTRKHVRKEEFATSPERLFEILITPSSICQWWSAARAIVVPEDGGTWAVAWGDDEDNPDYISVATIRLYQPPHRLVLNDYRNYAKAGALPFDADFLTEFVVSTTPSGASLQVTQDGFPTDAKADDFYLACKKGWEDTFARIRTFLEESKSGA